MAKKVRLVRVDYQVTWIEYEGDGENPEVLTGPTVSAKPSELDGLPDKIRAEVAVHERQINGIAVPEGAVPNRAQRRAKKGGNHA